METGGAIDFHEVALPKILDPRGAEGKHSRPGFLVCFRKAQGSVLVNLLRLGLSPHTKVLDVKQRVRRRGCGKRGRAVVSIKWAPGSR